MKKLLRDVTNEVAKRLNVYKDDSFNFAIALFKEITREIGKGNSIMIPNFGTFSAKLTKGRDLSGLLGRTTKIENYYTPKFKFADNIKSDLKEELRNNTKIDSQN